MRKTKIVTVAAEGRDKGKAFLLTEMGAVAAEKWATRALLALAKSGAEVPDEAVQAGAAAILSSGITAFRMVAFEDAEPLLDEMMICVQCVPDVSQIDPMTQLPVTRPMLANEIEEVKTLLLLRSEVFELHLGFSVRAALSMLAATLALSSSPTRTSRKRSAKPSVGGSRRSTNFKPSTA